MWPPRPDLGGWGSRQLTWSRSSMLATRVLCSLAPHGLASSRGPSSRGQAGASGHQALQWTSLSSSTCSVLPELSAQAS